MKIKIAIAKDYKDSMFFTYTDKSYIEIDPLDNLHHYTVYQDGISFAIDDKLFKLCAVSTELKDKYNYITFLVHAEKISKYYSYLFLKCVNGTFIAKHSFVTSHENIVDMFGKSQLAKSLYFDLGLSIENVFV